MPVIKKHLSHPSIFIASTDASARDKSRADYVCDGVADNVEIAAAIATLSTTYGGMITLSPGTFTLAASIGVTLEKGLHIRGSGYGTVLALANGVNDYAIKFTPPAAGIWAKFSDFRIDGNAGNQTAGGGISAAGSLECIFDSLWFYKCYDWGIYLSALDDSPLTYGHHNKILTCHFDEGSQSAGIGQGVRITENDENVIDNCDFQYMGGTARSTYGAIHDQSAGLNTFSNNVFVSCYRGIMTQDSSRTRMTNNIFDLCKDHNLVLKGEELIAIGNQFYEPSDGNAGNASAIFIDYYGHNTIMGNVLRSHSTNGTTLSLIRDEGNVSVGGRNMIMGNKFYIQGTLASGTMYQNINSCVGNQFVANEGLTDQNVINYGLVVNETGVDSDTRIEGDTATNLLVVDAGLEAVQVGTTTAGVIADFRSSAIVLNENGADRDTRIEGDTNANLVFVDASADKVGIGTSTPAEILNVIGNFQIDDAATPTKNYRFRTSATNLDFDASVKDMFISTYTAVNFTGTQRQYVQYGAEFEFEKHYKKTIWDDTGDMFVIDKDAAVGFVWNEKGDDTDARFEGDTDANLLYLDAGNSRIGVGTAAPSEKLEVAGNYKVIDSGATKAYRFRTSGASLDLDGGGADLYISMYDDAGFTTDQKVFMKFNATDPYVDIGGNWIFKDSIFGANLFDIRPDQAGVDSGINVNEDSGDVDFRIEGQTDNDLFHTDASTDRVGIGVAAPNNKLHVVGNVQVAGRHLQTQGADVGSANNLVLGSDGNTFEITGTTQINLISNLTWQNGAMINLLFTSTPTVKHNQTTSTTNITIQLAGAADFVASAGDVLSLVLCEIGGTQAWRELGRSVI